jgi:hypothetical protein
MQSQSSVAASDLPFASSAEPAAASPASASIAEHGADDEHSTANGNLSHETHGKPISWMSNRFSAHFSFCSFRFWFATSQNRTIPRLLS